MSQTILASKNSALKVRPLPSLWLYKFVLRNKNECSKFHVFTCKRRITELNLRLTIILGAFKYLSLVIVRSKENLNSVHQHSPEIIVQIDSYPANPKQYFQGRGNCSFCHQSHLHSYKQRYFF